MSQPQSQSQSGGIPSRLSTPSPIASRLKKPSPVSSFSPISTVKPTHHSNNATTSASESVRTPIRGASASISPSRIPVSSASAFSPHDTPSNSRPPPSPSSSRTAAPKMILYKASPIKPLDLTRTTSIGTPYLPGVVATPRGVLKKPKEVPAVKPLQSKAAAVTKRLTESSPAHSRTVSQLNSASTSSYSPRRRSGQVHHCVQLSTDAEVNSILAQARAAQLAAENVRQEERDAKAEEEKRLQSWTDSTFINEKTSAVPAGKDVFEESKEEVPLIPIRGLTSDDPHTTESTKISFFYDDDSKASPQCRRHTDQSHSEEAVSQLNISDELSGSLEFDEEINLGDLDDDLSLPDFVSPPVLMRSTSSILTTEEGEDDGGENQRQQIQKDLPVEHDALPQVEGRIEARLLQDLSETSTSNSKEIDAELGLSIENNVYVPVADSDHANILLSASNNPLHAEGELRNEISETTTTPGSVLCHDETRKPAVDSFPPFCESPAVTQLLGYATEQAIEKTKEDSNFETQGDSTTESNSMHMVNFIQPIGAPTSEEITSNEVGECAQQERIFENQEQHSSEQIEPLPECEVKCDAHFIPTAALIDEIEIKSQQDMTHLQPEIRNIYANGFLVVEPTSADSLNLPAKTLPTRTPNPTLSHDTRSLGTQQEDKLELFDDDDGNSVMQVNCIDEECQAIVCAPAPSVATPHEQIVSELSSSIATIHSTATSFADTDESVLTEEEIQVCLPPKVLASTIAWDNLFVTGELAEVPPMDIAETNPESCARASCLVQSDFDNLSEQRESISIASAPLDKQPDTNIQSVVISSAVTVAQDDEFDVALDTISLPNTPLRTSLVDQYTIPSMVVDANTTNTAATKLREMEAARRLKEDQAIIDEEQKAVARRYSLEQKELAQKAEQLLKQQEKTLQEAEEQKKQLKKQEEYRRKEEGLRQENEAAKLQAEQLRLAELEQKEPNIQTVGQLSKNALHSKWETGLSAVKLGRNGKVRTTRIFLVGANANPAMAWQSKSKKIHETLMPLNACRCILGADDGLFVNRKFAGRYEVCASRCVTLLSTHRSLDFVLENENDVKSLIELLRSYNVKVVKSST